MPRQKTESAPYHQLLADQIRAEVYAELKRQMPPLPPLAHLVDDAEWTEVESQYLGAWERLKKLLRQCPIADSQTKIAFAKAICGCVCEMLGCLDGGWRRLLNHYEGHNEYLTDVSTHLVSRVSNQGKGPREKHNLVMKRHDAMRNAISQGFTDEDKLYKFMCEQHDSLMRTKGRLISKRQMMYLFRKREEV